VNIENPKPNPANASIHFDMPREKYDAIKRMHWSKLKALAKSAAHLRHLMTEKDEDTEARKLGRVRHIAIFEPERFEEDVAVWEGGRRYGDEWEAFREEHEGKEIIKDEHAQEIRTLANAVRSDATAKKYVSGGRGEVTVLWTHVVPAIAGLPELRIDCKARIDFVANIGALVDVKTTRDASPEGFGRECWRYKHHVQAAMYRDAYEAATGRRLPYFLVAAESTAPYVVQVYRVPDPILEMGQQEYRALLERYGHCRAESTWPGYFDGEGELALPRWAMPFDEDAGGMGLEFAE
jgi:hypothetical protein